MGEWRILYLVYTVFFRLRIVRRGIREGVSGIVKWLFLFLVCRFKKVVKGVNLVIFYYIKELSWIGT